MRCRHPLDQVKRRPRHCIWDITRRCNLRCIHCENHSGPRSLRELSLPHMHRVADELAALGCQHVDVTGGEPLMHPNWQELCQHLKSLKMEVALVTNGMMLSDEMLDRILEAGVDGIAISIDGLQKTHDLTRQGLKRGGSPFEETLKGTERATQRCEVSVITQVNQDNLGELSELQTQLAKSGVTRWQLQLAVPSGRLLELEREYVLRPEQLPELGDFIAESQKAHRRPAIAASDTIGYYTEREFALRGRGALQALWMGCTAGIRAIAITYDGKVRGCSALPAEFDAGDLHEESLTTIWNDAERFAYSTRFDPEALSGDCKVCQFGQLCRGGCTTLAYWTTGSIYENKHCLHRLENLKS